MRKPSNGNITPYSGSRENFIKNTNTDKIKHQVNCYNCGTTPPMPSCPNQNFAPSPSADHALARDWWRSVAPECVLSPHQSYTFLFVSAIQRRHLLVAGHAPHHYQYRYTNAAGSARGVSCYLARAVGIRILNITYYQNQTE